MTAIRSFPPRWLLVLAALAVSAFAAVNQIWFMYTGSIRGAVMPYANGEACTADEALAPPMNTNICGGGCAQRQAFFDDTRAALGSTNIVLVDIGSSWWGSLFSFDTMATCINAAKYDVLSLGYADFFAGTNELSQFILQLNPTVDTLASNIDVENDIHMSQSRPGLPRYDGSLVVPWVVKTVANTKIVFVGIVPSAAFQFPSSQGIIPSDDSGVSDDFRIRFNVYRARQANPDADMVVVLSDIPPADARRLAREINGIHVFFHGDGENYGITEINSLFNTTVRLATIASNGLTVGQFRIDWDTVTKTAAMDAAFLGATTTMHTMVASTITSATVQSTFDATIAAARAIESTYGTSIGAALGELSDVRGNATDTGYPSAATIGCRTFDCALGREVVAAYRRACLSLTNAMCDVGFINAGSLRAPLPQGSITQANVMSVLTFRNMVYVLKLTGDQLLSALQNSITNLGAGGFAQTNIVYALSLNTNVDITQRLVDFRLADSTGALADIDRDRVYTVATNQYMYTGGDGYTIFQAASSAVPTSVDTDLLTEHVRSNSPLQTLSAEQLAACLANDVPIETMPAQNCRVVLSPLTASEAALCSTDLNVCLEPPAIVAAEFRLAPNRTHCNSCSGFGECSLRKCTCDVPTAGRFAGVEVFRGADCGEVLAEWTLNDGGQTAVYVFAALGLLLSVVMCLLIFLKRNERAIRATSPNFGYLICLGGVLASIGALLTVVPVDTVDCMAAMWLVVIGFVLIFGSLFVRTHRIHAIFNTHSLQALSKRMHTDFSLLQRLFVIFIVDVAILIVFQVMDPQTRRPVMVSDGFQAEIACKSDDSTFILALIVYNAALMVWGIYLAIRTRNVDSNFNESAFVGMAVYNCTFIGIIALALILTLNTDYPAAAKVVQGVAVPYVVIFTILVVYVPRFLKIKDASQMATTDTGNTSIQMAGLGAVEVAQFMNCIRKLEQELTDNGCAVPPRPQLPLGAGGNYRGSTGESGAASAGGGYMAGKPDTVPTTLKHTSSGVGAGNGAGGGGMFGRTNLALTRNYSNGPDASGPVVNIEDGPVDTADPERGGGGGGGGAEGTIYKQRPPAFDRMVSDFEQQKQQDVVDRAQQAQAQAYEAQRRAALQAAQDRNTGTLMGSSPMVGPRGSIMSPSAGAGSRVGVNVNAMASPRGGGPGAAFAGAPVTPAAAGAPPVVNPYAMPPRADSFGPGAANAGAAAAGVSGAGRGVTRPQRKLFAKPSGETAGSRRQL
jgi:2',3'-cyclic-nucleotide 2'-phosphodiesterase (5'-nucleotidase family)